MRKSFRKSGKSRKGGIRKVIVPSLSGLSRAQAKTLLESVGLAWYETSSSVQNVNLDQSIVSQETASGTTVNIGQSISFSYYVYVAPPPPPPPPSDPYPNIGSVITYGAGAGQSWTQDQAYVTWGGSGWGSYTVTASNGSSNNSASSGGGPPVLLSGFSAGTSYSVTVTLYANANYSGASASSSGSFTTASAPAGPPSGPPADPPADPPAAPPAANCTSCTGYPGHPAATETFSCSDGCGTYTMCYTPIGCANYIISPCPGCPPATPPTTDCTSCTGYPGNPSPTSTYPCGDGCGTYTVCNTPAGCANYNISSCPGCPPAGPPADPPAGPPAGPPADPPAGPPAGPPADPPALPPFSKSVSVSTLVRTPSGLVRAENLNVGDVLLSADIEGFPYTTGEGVTEAALAWTDTNPNLNIVNTTIVEIKRRTATKAVVINGDIFSQYHWILVKRNGLTQFVRSENIIEGTDYIFDADTNLWEIVDLFEVIEVNHETISINCEPYDMFFTEKMLTHDSFSI